MKRNRLIASIVCLLLMCLSCTAAVADSVVFSEPSARMDLGLARQSAALCDVSYRPVALREKLISMGFEADAIVQKDYDTDALHSAAMTMARGRMKDAGGNECTVYAIVVRGTYSGREMASNFLVGDGDISAGFQQAAERAYGHWQAYAAQYPPADGGNCKVWICGHSRGAAVANLLAGYYLPMDLNKEQIYGYTFATPNVQKTVDTTAPVFNFIIDGDVVTRVPPAEWGFVRHGTDIHYDGAFVDDVAISTKADTDRLIRTLLEGGLTHAYYRGNIEPLLIASTGSEVFEEGSVTPLILPLLQNINQSIAEDKMNLAEMAAYAQKVMPSHRIETYIAWLDTMQ